MRTREQLMQEWDEIRVKIASGCANSGPRDWLEGVLDDYDKAIADAERRAREWRNVVAANLPKEPSVASQAFPNPFKL